MVPSLGSATNTPACSSPIYSLSYCYHTHGSFCTPQIDYRPLFLPNLLAQPSVDRIMPPRSQRSHPATKPATSPGQVAPNPLGNANTILTKSTLYYHRQTGGTCVNLQPENLKFCNNYVLQTQDGHRPDVDWLEQNGYLQKGLVLQCYELARRQGRYAVLPPMDRSSTTPAQSMAEAPAPLKTGNPGQFASTSGSKPSLPITRRAVQPFNTSNTPEPGKQQALPSRKSVSSRPVARVNITITKSALQSYKWKDGCCTKIATQMDKKGHGHAYHLVNASGVGLSVQALEACYGSTVEAECHQVKIANPGAKHYWYNYAIIRKLPATGTQVSSKANAAPVRRVLPFQGIDPSVGLRRTSSTPNLGTPLVRDPRVAQVTNDVRAQFMGRQVQLS